MRRRNRERRMRRLPLMGAVAALLLAGCAPSARFAQPGPSAEAGYRQADIRPGYYVDMGGGTGVPAQLYVYTGAPVP